MSRSHRFQWNYTRSAHTLTRHLDSRCIVEFILCWHEARRIVKNQQKICLLSGILVIFFYFLSTECCVMAVQAVIRCIARSYYAFVFICLSLFTEFPLFVSSFLSSRCLFPLLGVLSLSTPSFARVTSLFVSFFIVLQVPNMHTHSIEKTTFVNAASEESRSKQLTKMSITARLVCGGEGTLRVDFRVHRRMLLCNRSLYNCNCNCITSTKTRRDLVVDRVCVCV